MLALAWNESIYYKLTAKFSEMEKCQRKNTGNVEAENAYIRRMEIFICMVRNCEVALSDQIHKLRRVERENFKFNLVLMQSKCIVANVFRACCGFSIQSQDNTAQLFQSI